MTLGFLGSGNMAAAMARGWAGADSPPAEMLFTDRGSGRAAALAEELAGGPAGGADLSTEALGDNAELAARSDLLILGCKPADLERVASGAQVSSAVLSLLGATPVARVAEHFPEAAVYRVMPNLAVELRRGVLCLATNEAPAGDAVAGGGADSGGGGTAGIREGAVRRGDLIELLGQLGRVHELPESNLDAATAVMGCSPAYLDLFVDALAGGGVIDGGLDPGLARQLTLEAFEGSLALIASRKPGEVRRAVASPGGSTEAGLRALEENGFAEVAAGAVRASLERMRGAG